MNNPHCEYRDHVILAEPVEHADGPLPWAGGCRIVDPSGQRSRHLSLPIKRAFLADLEHAQQASLAHGRWLVDQHLDHGEKLFERVA